MRIFMGIVWFIILQFLFGIIGGCTSTYIQRSMGVPRSDVGTPPQAFLIIFLLALIVAVWGTVTGKLPGTKKKEK